MKAKACLPPMYLLGFHANQRGVMQPRIKDKWSVIGPEQPLGQVSWTAVLPTSPPVAPQMHSRPKKFGRNLVDATFHASCQMRALLTCHVTLPSS
jgi:hypothetical protein